jgi:pimeloyl-ACP methyl ester carboxylesterase
MPYATNPDDGVRIYYEVEGDGPPLVYQHGFTWWSGYVRELGYADVLAGEYRLILIDARGHGRSDKPHEPEAYGRRMVDDVVAVLDDLSIEKAHISGYSLGGLTTLGVGLRAPERAHSLVVGGAGPPMGPPPEGDLAAVLLEVLQDGGVAGLAGAIEQGLAAAGLPVHESLMQRIRASDAEAFIAVLAGLDQTPWTAAELSAMTVPCLFIAGDADANHAAAKQGAELMPNATLVSLEGLDHFAVALSADVFVPPMREFLARVEAEIGAAT